MKITYQSVSFQDVIDNIQIEGDKYGVAQRSLVSARKEAFLANPFLEDKNATMLLLAKVDDVVCGKRMFYPTKIRAKGEVFTALGGSNYYVNPDYRKYALGGAMIMSAAKKVNVFLLSAGCSEDSLKIYEAMKAVRFIFPKFTLPTRVFSATFQPSGNYIIRAWNNARLVVRYKRVKKYSDQLNEKFIVKEGTIIPNWAEEMVLNDGHPYMEYHNRDWLQWNLDYNFGGSPESGNIQKFFSVSYQGKPIGFFMITERLRQDGVIGLVQEWQSSDSSLLSDADIMVLSVKYFSKNVDYITVASADEKTQDTLSKNGFIKNGTANIVLKDLLKKYDDIDDMSKWRIRLGYADYIMS